MNQIEDKQKEVRKWLKKRNGVLLAHYYQEKEIQDIADFIGDSLELAKFARNIKQETIVMAGVKFMAETAKILNPEKKVILPSFKAGCSLADSCETNEFKAYIDSIPNNVVVTYINTSADIKALSDYVCTSSNAIEVINSIPIGKNIIFAPDYNLGKYVSKKTGRNMHIWNGQCIVHVEFSMQKINSLLDYYKDAKLIAHPESNDIVLERADFVGSTSKLLKYVIEDNCMNFVVATEVGIIHKMREAAPNKNIIPAPITEDNSCACSICPYMKEITLDNILNSLINGKNNITLDKDIQNKAIIPLMRMINTN